MISPFASVVIESCCIQANNKVEQELIKACVELLNKVRPSRLDLLGAHR